MRVHFWRSRSTWFLVGAIAASVPWAWLVPFRLEVPANRIEMMAGIHRAILMVSCAAGTVGFSTGLEIFDRAPRLLVALLLGAALGSGVLFASNVVIFPDNDYFALVVGAFTCGVVVGALPWTVRNTP